MVVNQDQRSCAQVEPAADDFARVDRGFIQAAVADVFVMDQQVLTVKIKYGCIDDSKKSDGVGFAVEFYLRFVPKWVRETAA